MYAVINQSKRSLPILRALTDDPVTPNLSELPEPDKLKSLAGEIRQHTLDHLDHYLRIMEKSVVQNNGHFHLAATARDAKQYIAKAIASANCQTVRYEPSPIFNEIEYGHVEHNEGADALITGANFAVAETGQVCVCRDTAPTSASPRVIVCLLGMESIVPRLADLAVMLKLLGRSSIGRPMTINTEIIGAKLSTAFHVIFVDNGRRKILAGEHRSALRCIGCGACSAVCPVYQEIRRDNEVGQASPIAAILSPLMKSLSEFDELPFASTLCGACSAVCPVGIDLPWHLTRLRAQLVEQENRGLRERLSHRLRVWVLMSARKYRRIGSTAWKLNAPPDAPAPAAKSFRELWKER